ncbi:WYL domain-containing protein, partial [Aggregatibacter actinomycetemcomitans]
KVYSGFCGLNYTKLLCRLFFILERSTRPSQSDSISHGNQLDEVIIKVDAKVAHYFTRRALLPNQEIIRHIENGELLIACKNIHEMEIIPLVQYWIPYLMVISPREMQKKITHKLQQYLISNN